MGKPNRSWLIQTGKVKAAKKPRTIIQQCSDCRQFTKVQRSELRKAARLRCSRCGGPLNRPRQA